MQNMNKLFIKGGAMGLILGMIGIVLAADLPQNELSVVQEQRIEIIIRNSEFLLSQSGGVQFGLPTVIILRNQDIVRHGFTSPMLLGQSIQGEGEGIAAYGKGVEGFYIDAGKTLVIRFIPQRQGRYEFRCDLHPQMRGEVFLLEMGTA